MGLSIRVDDRLEVIAADLGHRFAGEAWAQVHVDHSLCEANAGGAALATLGLGRRLIVGKP